MIHLKRAYEQPEAADGYRILVDRLWPRGVTKEKAKIDSWQKEIAPSKELRQWFNHDPEKFEEFKRRYTEELTQEPTAFNQLLALIKKEKNITFVYSAKDEKMNNAIVLKTIIEQQQNQ